MHVAGGATEAHFSFFVVMVLLTLYEDWTVFALAVVYTLLHHGVLGMIDPGEVFSAHPGNPWKWAVIHAVFVAAAGSSSPPTGWRRSARRPSSMTSARSASGRDPLLSPVRSTPTNGRSCAATR